VAAAGKMRHKRRIWGNARKKAASWPPFLLKYLSHKTFFNLSLNHNLAVTPRA
jgi:hypothetical protein